MKTVTNIHDIIAASERHKLYAKLIQQLNKDFLYANIDVVMEESISPQQLKMSLHETIFKLIQNRFSDYLNLLYIVDVSEENIKQLDGNAILVLSEQVAFLILKREWEKVWFKNTYS